MTVALIIIGDEILAGHVQDVNTHNLAGRFRALGYSLVEVRVVPDHRDKISGTILELAGQSPAPSFIFTCGGIGPTHDDETHEAVADALDVPLERNGEMVGMIRQFYERRKWCCDDGEHVVLNEASLRMADVPRGMNILKNDKGTAPGMWCEMPGGGPKLVVLPGPPGEVGAIFDHSIAGALMPEKEDKPVSREVRVPHGESRFSHILADVARDHPGVDIGSYPQQGVRLVILRLSGPEEAVLKASADLEGRLDAGGFL
jgi:molybdopterin-biosynthesis enzyme MoeA-like protein